MARKPFYLVFGIMHVLYNAVPYWGQHCNAVRLGDQIWPRSINLLL